MNPSTLAMNDDEKGCLTEVFNAVKDFHIAFNHPHPNTLTQITKERKKARAAWMQEEINEFLLSDSITEDIDSMVDLIYFALGTAVEIMGKDGGEQLSHIFELVQHANMSKLWDDGKPHYNSQGKVIKPEGWEAPDKKIKEYIDEIIKTQANQLEILNE